MPSKSQFPPVLRHLAHPPSSSLTHEDQQAFDLAHLTPNLPSIIIKLSHYLKTNVQLCIANLCMQRFNQLLRTPISSLLQPHSPSLITLLQTVTDPQKLRPIHAYMIVTGIVQDSFAASQLLSAPALVEYRYARSIFASISCPNIFTRNTMIKKLIENNTIYIDPVPLVLYVQMLDAGLRPDGHTFMYLIKAVAATRRDVREGEEVHASVVRTGFGSSQFVSCALLGFYVNCGCIDRGRQVFDEMSQRGLVVWTAMVRAYVCVSLPRRALELFRNMREVGLMPDSVALAVVVSACAQLGELGVAKGIHGFISKSGIEIDEFVSSGLLSMYGDCGCLDLAHQHFLEMPMKNIVTWNTMIHQCVERKRLELAKELFESMTYRDVVSWNTMIQGLSRLGKYKEALALFREMESSGVRPNTLTLSSTLSACAGLGALDTGTWIHAHIEKNDINEDGSLDSSLIEMYSKCGNIDKAVQIFEKSGRLRRDLFSWTSIICGLAMHGCGKMALHYFSKMEEEAEVKPDDITLIGVLNACAHAGLLDQGWLYFRSMEEVYDLKPKIEHYGCMVDLLGRKGFLKAAYELIMEMPMESNEVVWGAFLSACRVHNNVELGEVAARRLLQLDPHDPWARVMLSNMYAKDAIWDWVQRLRKEMKDKGLKKPPGCSSIEVNGTVHEFLVGDNSHPNHAEIHSMIKKIEKNIEVVILLTNDSNIY